MSTLIIWVIITSIVSLIIGITTGEWREAGVTLAALVGVAGIAALIVSKKSSATTTTSSASPTAPKQKGSFNLFTGIWERTISIITLVVFGVLSLYLMYPVYEAAAGWFSKKGQACQKAPPATPTFGQVSKMQLQPPTNLPGSSFEGKLTAGEVKTVTTVQATHADKIYFKVFSITSPLKVRICEATPCQDDWFTIPVKKKGKFFHFFNSGEVQVSSDTTTSYQLVFPQ